MSMRPWPAVCCFITALPTLTAASAAVHLGVGDLIRIARPGAGECYTVALPEGRVSDAPDRLFAYAARGARDAVRVRVPVPKDGYYSVRSRLLVGPWTEGRHGRFQMRAGCVKLPRVYQGWYGVQREPPFRITNHEWGAVHLSAPAVELALKLTHGAHGNKIFLTDIRLEPRSVEKLKDEDRARRAPAAVEKGETQQAASAWPLCQIRRQRGLEWTTLVRRPAQDVEIDARLKDWPAASSWPIRMDGSIPPGHGWATPKPAGDADLSARVAVAWDEGALYVAAQVRDDDRQAKTDEQKWGSPWSHDGLVVAVCPPGWLTTGHRTLGPSPQSVTFGLNYVSPGATPRELPLGSRYVVCDTEDGYALEAAITFKALGWQPARVGDRFPFSLILVDRDPTKPAGLRFDQYGWNYGPGSMAGMGEMRLMGSLPVAGELIAEHEQIAPSCPIRYVGTVDASQPAELRVISIVRLSDGEAAATFPTPRHLTQPGRYGLLGELPARDLPRGQYELQLLWQ